MDIEGTVFRITDPARFIASFTADPENVDLGSVRPVSGARVILVVNEPRVEPAFAFLERLVPDVNLAQVTGAQGRFLIRAPNRFRNSRGRFIVLRDAGTVLGFHLRFPVYRSAGFRLGAATGRDNRMFFRRQPMDEDQGLDSDGLSDQLEAFRRANGLRSMTGVIRSGLIHVEATMSRDGHEGSVEFDVKLVPAASRHLEVLLTNTMEEFRVDVPGPSFGVGAFCPDKREIQRQVQDGLNRMTDDLSEALRDQLVEAIAEESGVPAAMVRTVLAEQAVLTIERIRWPVIRRVRTPLGSTVRFRAIVTDLSIGFPQEIA